MQYLMYSDDTSGGKTTGHLYNNRGTNFKIFHELLNILNIFYTKVTTHVTTSFHFVVLV